jgi:alcohol dehydrogenase class IV
VADALGVEDAAAGIHDLAIAIGAPTSLEAIGMPASGIDEAAERIVAAAAANPRPPELDGIRQMLDDAFGGRRPTSCAAT